jgi:hypothetical protein
MERILKAAIEKQKVTYKGKARRMTADFSIETLEARMAWNEVPQFLRENN